MDDAAPTIPQRDEIEDAGDSQHSLGNTLLTADEYASSFRSRMSRTPPWHQDEYLERPTEIFDFLYLGNMDNARDKDLLERLGITHIINCVGSVYENYHTGHKYYGETIRRYVEFNAEDLPQYNMIRHFDDAYDVIEDARKTNGKAFIHCEVGVNRSGMLTVAYVMVNKGWDPITAGQYVKDKRKWLLSNVSFQRQLIEFARSRDLVKLQDGQQA